MPRFSNYDEGQIPNTIRAREEGRIPITPGTLPAPAPAEPMQTPGTPDGGSFFGPPPEVTAPIDQDVSTLPSDAIGDIPPPPIPAPPISSGVGGATPPIPGIGVGGLPGTEGSTFARPGTPAARPFRTPASYHARPPRFGPGVPQAGGGIAEVSGLGGVPGLNPDDAAELLRRLAMGGGGGF